MAMRVSQQMMYSSFTSNLNRNLSNLMESQLQMTTQRKLNRPSDDPAGAGRVISLRANIDRLHLYEDNIKTAEGWLKSAGDALSSVQTILSKIKTLSQQGADGTKTPENRRQIAFELRENFMQLITLANTNYNGKNIFSGHKTENNSYELDLGATYTQKTTSANGEDIATSNGAFPNQMQISVTSVSGGTVNFEYQEWDSKNNAWGPVVTAQALDRGAKTSLSIAGGRTLSIDTTNGDLKAIDSQTFTVMDPKTQGSANFTTIIQAVGNDGSGISGLANDPAVKFRYSNDSGKTWEDATKQINPDNTISITAGGAVTTISAQAWIEKVDPEIVNENNNGTWLFLRPTAQYKGDDHDTQVTMNYGAKAEAAAQGFFASDVNVKITGIDASTGEITYGYSTDNGINWVEGRKGHLDASGTMAKLSVPGGFLNLNGAPLGINDIKEGDQYTILPHRADINLSISSSDAITVNMVGKDIFGGTYLDPVTGQMTIVDGGANNNVFEVVGRLIGYAESGSQEGMQKALDELDACMRTVLTANTLSGGRLNRLEVTAHALETQKLNELSTLSTIEDVDLQELLTRLEQQKLAYNAVGKSASMIMQMSLLNFL